MGGGETSKPAALASPDVEVAPEPTRPGSRYTVAPDVPTVGSKHDHDHWLGRSEAVIFDADLPASPTGVCAGYNDVACMTEPRAERVHLRSSDDPTDPPNNVWPGTGRITFELALDGTILLPFRVRVRGPGLGPTGVVHAMDSARLTIDFPDLLENQTDAPHARTSQWYLAFEGKAVTEPEGPNNRFSLYTGTMHAKATIFRSGRPLPVDPPHPDLWDGRTSIELMDKEVQEDKALYLAGGAMKYGRHLALPSPNRTVLPGAERMVVVLSWTNTVPGQVPLHLLTCDPSASCTDVGWASHEIASESPTERRYAIDLRPEQCDTPYVEQSKWQFTWMFDGGTGAFAGKVRFRVEIQRL